MDCSAARNALSEAMSTASVTVEVKADPPFDSDWTFRLASFPALMVPP
jgi:hypothetical protein